MEKQNKILTTVKELVSWTLCFAGFLVVMTLVFYILSHALVVLGGVLLIVLFGVFLYGAVRR